MEVKITGNQAVYTQVMNQKKSGSKPVDIAKTTEGRTRQDEIVISGDGVRRQEAAQAAEKAYESMAKEVKADRIAQLRQQVQDGTYNIPAEVVAGRILSGM